MSIKFHCDHCGKKIEAPDNAGGKWGKCPSCHNKLYVPNLNPGDEELKLAPIDTSAKEREKQLMAETYRLTQDILQERVVPEGGADTAELDDTAEMVFGMSNTELMKYIILYLRQMADGELAEAQKIEALIEPHKAQAVGILDKITQGEIQEQELADVPQQVISSLVRTLRSEIS
jgi:hypothetical protein